MRPLPTGRLALLALIGSALVLALPVRPPVGLIAVDGVLAVLAILDAVRAVRPAALDVERDLPRGLPIGATDGSVTWRVRNPSGRAVRIAIADELAPSLGAASRRARMVIPAGGAASATVAIHPTRRGRFQPSEMVVRVDGPWRLASVQASRVVRSTLRVLPPFRSRDEAELRIRRARLLEVGLRSAQGRGGGTEFDALREYTVDDEMVRMDWAATARTGKPIVRTYRAERNQQVIVLLDTGRVMAGRVEDVPRLEWGMDAALTLTAVATRLGDRCGLLAFDREVRRIVAPAVGSAQLARVTEAIYDLDARLVESDYRGAFAAALARFRRRALLVLVTELTEEAIEDTLIPALPLLLGRHMVIVASVTDPDVARWADEPPEGATEAYRAAAAGRALEVRGRSVARLRALGVTVVDLPPARMPAAVADAYLRVKAAGRL